MIPNFLEDVKAARTKYADAWTHAHVDGDLRRYEFIKLLAADIHAKNAKVGNNGKRGNPLDLSMDALNILCDVAESAGRTPEGLPCVVVDVIGGAGGPNPQPVWNVFDTFVEGSGANVKPGAVPTPQPTIPSYEALGGDAYWREELGVPLQSDMALANAGPLNDGSSVWFSRPIYRILEAYAKGQTPDRPAIIKSVRNEWRAILGLPPLP